MTDDVFIKNALTALAEFPLPDPGLTRLENYKRMLDWLYSGEVAAIVVGLSYGMKKVEREKSS